jgi:hypothetical protein
MYGIILPAQPNINADVYERLRLISGQMRTDKRFDKFAGSEFEQPTKFAWSKFE